MRRYWASLLMAAFALLNLAIALTVESEFIAVSWVGAVLCAISAFLYYLIARPF